MRTLCIKYTFILVSLVCYSNVFSQAISERIGQIREGNIQPCVFVEISNGGGSGILVNNESSIYLITAKHVIFNILDNDLLKIKSDRASIKFFTKDFVNEQERLINIDLARLLNSEYIRIHPQEDICVIKLANHSNREIKYLPGVTRKYDKVIYNPFPIHEPGRISGKSDLFLGDDLITVGFPISLGLSSKPQFDYNRPLLKKCSVSSLSDVFPTLVMDCSAYGGNSGGAVFLERTDANKFSISLIGIVIERIPFINRTKDSGGSTNTFIDETSSYSVVVPIKYALDLISTF